MRPGSLALGCLLLVGFSGKLEAGTFRITNIQYETLWETDDIETVLVTAVATYHGRLDVEDDNWLLLTLMNDSIGDDLGDWDNPDYWGPGVNGTDILRDVFVSYDSGCCRLALAIQCWMTAAQETQTALRQMRSTGPHHTRYFRSIARRDPAARTATGLLLPVMGATSGSIAIRAAVHRAIVFTGWMWTGAESFAV